MPRAEPNNAARKDGRLALMNCAWSQWDLRRSLSRMRFQYFTLASYLHSTRPRASCGPSSPSICAFTVNVFDSSSSEIAVLPIARNVHSVLFSGAVRTRSVRARAAAVRVAGQRPRWRHGETSHARGLRRRPLSTATQKGIFTF